MLWLKLGVREVLSPGWWRGDGVSMLYYLNRAGIFCMLTFEGVRADYIDENFMKHYTTTSKGFVQVQHLTN